MPWSGPSPLEGQPRGGIPALNRSHAQTASSATRTNFEAPLVIRWEFRRDERYCHAVPASGEIASRIDIFDFDLVFDLKDINSLRRILHHRGTARFPVTWHGRRGQTKSHPNVTPNRALNRAETRFVDRKSRTFEARRKSQRAHSDEKLM